MILSRFYAVISLLLALHISPSKSLTTNQQQNPKRVCIVGAGPAGLFLAHLLLKDETVQINILEKAPRDGTADANAFGFGVGLRHQRCLEQIPGLWKSIEAKSAPTTGGPKVRIIGRNVLCQELVTKLEEADTGNRCTVSYETDCRSIDMEKRTIAAANGAEYNYDLLVACDGVNSRIRRMLVGKKGLKEEHYLRDCLWKSLKIPKQPASVLDPGAFKPLSHPSLNGAIIPRYPEGHTALIFWKALDRNNPAGVDTPSDLASAIAQAVQPKASKRQIGRKLFFFRASQITNKEDDKEIPVQFDDQDLQRCIHSTSRQEHYLKLDRYHDTSSRVALVGDAAHGMYSFLGQGAACAFQSAHILAQSLQESDDIPAALEAYSKKAVPEGHAINDLNLLTHTIFGGFLGKLLTIPLLLLNALRGKLLMTRLNEDITYQQIYKENSLLVKIARYFWKKHRISFEKKSNASIA